MDFSPTRDGAHNPRMCTNQESNQHPLGTQDDAQTTQPQGLGLKPLFHQENDTFYFYSRIRSKKVQTKGEAREF